jgi:hypothetical protein
MCKFKYIYIKNHLYIYLIGDNDFFDEKKKGDYIRKEKAKNDV